MRLPFTVLLALCIQTIAMAAPWQFEPPVVVTEISGPRIFHHLDSAGRRNIAVSHSTVAVVWEDERDGSPRVYLAKKRLAAEAFEREMVLSGTGEAFEPTIVALDDGRFAVAWEEGGQVIVRVVGEQAGPQFRISSLEAVQPTLAAIDGKLVLATAERSGRFSRIVVHRLKVGADHQVTEVAHCAVDNERPKDEQLYPAVAMQAGRIIVAWEDRRPGHTIIMASQSVLKQACQFAQPQRISLRPERGQKMPYGKGHGVTRVSLGAYGRSRVLAAWADKRDFREGYDIYAATLSEADGFGANERVQDAFGGVARQWHPSVAGHVDGSVVVAWDDDRDGDANVLLSWREGDKWSEDFALPGADGAGEQANPTITLDAKGNLHAAWVERKVVGGATRLHYAFGRRQPGE